MIGKITGTLYWAPQIYDLVDTAGNYIFLEVDIPDEVTNASAMLDPDLGNAGEISLKNIHYVTFRIVDKDQQDLKIIASLEDGTEVIETYDLKDLTCLGPYWFELSAVPNDVTFIKTGSSDNPDIVIDMNDLVDFNAPYVVDNDHGIITVKLLGDHSILPLGIRSSAAGEIAMLVSDKQLSLDYFNDVIIKISTKDSSMSVLKNWEEPDNPYVFYCISFDEIINDFQGLNLDNDYSPRFGMNMAIPMSLPIDVTLEELNASSLIIAQFSEGLVYPPDTITYDSGSYTHRSITNLKKYSLDITW